MEDELKKTLAENGINVSSFAVPNISFSDAFTESIERKETARQDSLREEYNTARYHELANQKIETARGEAESMKLVADAEAYAIQERANAAASNPQALEFEVISKWDGRLPMVVGDKQSLLLKTVLPDVKNPPRTANSGATTVVNHPATQATQPAPVKISTQTPRVIQVQAQNAHERGARE